jgi:hypothetical protein
MAHNIYENFFLANEVEDQLNSHLDLSAFCTVDNSLVGTPGMIKKINVYRATDGTEKLTVGQGNSKSIEVSHTTDEYEIEMAQNRFDYFDEEEMTDPNLVPVGMKHAGTDMYNTIQSDIYAEFSKTGLEVPATTPDFDAFVDAQSALGVEDVEGVESFALCNPKDKAKVRKALKDDLKYVSEYAKTGYIGTVAGTNVYVKADATEGEIIVATKGAVTIFNKKGVEIEQERDANIRKNSVFSRKYYIVALTDETKAVKIKLGAGA